MTNSFLSLLIFIADHDRYARRKGQKMYFTSRKHKICHSERREESAGTRPLRAHWGDLGAGSGSGGCGANCPLAPPRSAEQRILRGAQNDKFFNIFANIYTGSFL